MIKARHGLPFAVAIAVVCWFGVAASTVRLSAQAAPAGVPLSDQVFKNIQILKGIPVDQFMDAMGMFSASLGYDCSSCHSQDIHYDRAAFATTTPLITRARQMINMMTVSYTHLTLPTSDL